MLMASVMNWQPAAAKACSAICLRSIPLGKSFGNSQLGSLGGLHQFCDQFGPSLLGILSDAKDATS